MDNKSLPAFPLPHPAKEDGISKWEYFAAAALQGILSNPTIMATTNLSVAAGMAKGVAETLLDKLEEK